MSEPVIESIVKILTVAAFAILYMLGGRRFKWLRRYVAPAVLLAGSFFTASDWEWYYVIPFVWLFLVLRLGYGADDDEDVDKIVRRTLYGFGFGLAGLVLGFMTGHGTVGIAQMMFAVGVSLFLGVLNPLKAVHEETLIGGISIIFVPFMV